jgi:predicted small secreted protein
MRNTIARIALCALVLSGAVSVLSACNTMEGAGQDMSSAGHAISNSADRNK